MEHAIITPSDQICPFWYPDEAVVYLYHSSSRVRITAEPSQGGSLTYTVRLLTPDLWPALEDLFGEERPASRCWCMYWRIGSKYRERPREANKAALCDLVMSSPLQAYWPSTVTWPWAGASQSHGMPWRGLRIAGASGA